jgi:hypothetical protein
MQRFCNDTMSLGRCKEDRAVLTLNRQRDDPYTYLKPTAGVVLVVFVIKRLSIIVTRRDILAFIKDHVP